MAEFSIIISFNVDADSYKTARSVAGLIMDEVIHCGLAEGAHIIDVEHMDGELEGDDE